MRGAMLGDANSPILQFSDQAMVAGAGVTTATQLTSSKTPCSLVEVTAYEGNAQPMMIGGSGVKLGTQATAYSDRVGSGVMYPGTTKIFAVPDASLLYQSGLASDYLSWTILK